MSMNDTVKKLNTAASVLDTAMAIVLPAQASQAHVVLVGLQALFGALAAHETGHVDAAAVEAEIRKFRDGFASNDAKADAALAAKFAAK